jgi:alginate O-acetyltransferase complex protein AlgI
MIFNSTVFLIFFILFFFLYWLINNRLSVILRNFFIVISSYIFYGWWDWRFLSLIAFSSGIDFLIGILLDKTENQAKRKILLVATVGLNLGILGFFKYFNFFAASLNELLGQFNIHAGTTTLNIILPVGISFYTFQTMSYTIDVYNRKLKSTRDIVSFFAFVSFFPQLVAGPIERAKNLLGQFFGRKTFSYDLCISGLRLMLWGFFKKIVIADNFGLLADSVFNQPGDLSGVTVLAGAIFFGLQIYADFSGYSDIAIGIAKMLGFELMTNFRTPYFARSFGDFWRRWHISLSTWFRDYLYIPLGGNKLGSSRMYFNLFITFLLSGLWHGANSTFIIWGGLHGLLLVSEKLLKFGKPRIIYQPFVLICVILLWLPFRATDFTHLSAYAGALLQFPFYSFEQLAQVITNYSHIRFLVLIAIFLIFIIFEYFIRNSDFNAWIKTRGKISRISVYYFLILAILFIGNFSVKPDFIYFQF